MLFARKNKYLSFYDAEKYPRGLGVIGENSLAIGENFDRGPPDLLLVWQQGETLAKRNQENRPIAPAPAPIQKHGWWVRFKDTAERIGALVAIILLVPGFLGTVIWVTWSLSKYDSRFEEIEKAVSGSGGLTDQVRKLGDDVGGVKSTLASFEKILLPQILELLKPKAAKALGTSDVGVFNVAHNAVTTDAEFSALFDSPNLFSPKKLLVSYAFKGEGNGRFSLRSRLQIVEVGRILKTIKDSTSEHVLPSREGESEQYCLSFVSPEFQYATSPVCIEVVLLERVGPENLVYASAVKSGQDS